jgi:hypothetical protein
MSEQDIHDCQDATQAAVDTRMSEMQATIHVLEAQGWKWSEDDKIDRVLASPDDSNVNVWFDPYTGEQFLSPKLVELLKNRLGQDPKEIFSPNPAINADIHEMLVDFPEPSRSRMRKKIIQDRDALLKHRTDETDQNARHTFREFLVAHQLNRNGFNLEYSRKIAEQTPDWFDPQNNLLLEVFTCERGGKSPAVQRVAPRIAEKVTKYKKAIEDNELLFVVAVHGDFLSLLDADDCQQAIADECLFERYPILSGVVFFSESNAFRVKQADGSTQLKQQYRYKYFSNPNATRAIDLTSALAAAN